MSDHQHNSDPLLDLSQAAIYLGNVSEKTVRREIERCSLQSVRVGRLLRVRRSALEAYLRNGTTP